MISAALVQRSLTGQKKDAEHAWLLAPKQSHFHLLPIVGLSLDPCRRKLGFVCKYFIWEMNQEVLWGRRKNGRRNTYKGVPMWRMSVNKWGSTWMGIIWETVEYTLKSLHCSEPVDYLSTNSCTTGIASLSWNVNLLVCACVHAHLGLVWLFWTPWTVTHQALCPWNLPGKNTGVGCHFLLHNLLILNP